MRVWQRLLHGGGGTGGGGFVLALLFSKEWRHTASGFCLCRDSGQTQAEAFERVLPPSQACARIKTESSALTQL